MFTLKDFVKINEKDHSQLPDKFKFKMTNMALRVKSGKHGKIGICLNKCKQIKNKNISECQLKYKEKGFS